MELAYARNVLLFTDSPSAARRGAFFALKAVSPLAESRLTPLLDIPDPVLRDGATLESHFAKRAAGISEAWPKARPLYVDMHNLPPQIRMASGAHPLEYIFEQLSRSGTRAIPVTGTATDRDPAYSETVRRIASGLRQGACLRLAREDFANLAALRNEIARTLDSLALSPADCDLLIDFRYVKADEKNELRELALGVVGTASRVGNFRNMVVAGGSIPEQLGKKDNGTVRREPRTELEF